MNSILLSSLLFEKKKQLLIKGIRAFAPDHDHVITFPKPLTLIVGSNGAGKTTIIECLKMGSTGELPPSARSGQAFIHDPKVADTTEVKAQIKLRFQNSIGKPFVVIRSFQLVQKANGKLEKKDLDQVIQLIDEVTGEKVSLTKKCADINVEVPIMMGVSKAILENVVFVHQEESNWPLGEGAILKKKFDDIFSATKYTKALEHIRKLRLEQAAELKEVIASVVTSRVHKDHAVKLQMQRDENEEKARVLEAKIASVDADIAQARQNAEEIEDMLEAARRLGDQTLTLESRLGAVKAENERKVQRIENLYTETLEELEVLRENFNLKGAELIGERDALHKEVRELQMQEGALKDKKDTEFRKVGRLQAEQEQHVNRLEQRSQHAKEIAEQNAEIGAVICNTILNSVGEHDLEEENNMKVFRKALGDRLEVSKDASINAREKRQNAHAEATSAVVNVEMKIKRNEEKIKDKGKHREDLRSSVDKIGEELSRSTVSDSALEELKRSFEEAQRNFEKKRKEADSDRDIKSDIAQIESEIEATDKKLSILRSEQEEAARAGETQVKIRLKRDEVASKKEALSSILNSRKDRLEAAFQGFDKVPEPLFLSEEVKKIAKERREVVSLSERELASSKTMKESRAREVEVAKTTLKSWKDDAHVCEAQASDGVTAALLGPDGLLGVDNAMHTINEEITEIQGIRTTIEASMKLFDNYITKCSNDQTCPLCVRAFPNVAEANDFEQNLKARMESAPAQIEAQDNKIAIATAKREKLLGLTTIAARYKDLKEKRIPQAESAYETAKDVLKTAEETEKIAEASLTDKKKLRDTVLAVVDDAATISRHAQELNSLETQLRMMPGSSTKEGEGIRSISDIASDLDVEQANRESRESQLKVLRKKKERTETELAQLERNSRDAKDSHAEAEKNALQRLTLKEEQTKLENEIDETTKEIEVLERAISPLQEEKNKLEREREERVKIEKENEDAIDDKTRTLQKSIDFFDSLNNPIQSYIESSAQQDLLEIQTSLESADAKIESIQKKLAAKLKEFKSKEKNLNKQSELDRTLQDNIAFQRGKKEEKQIEMQLHSLKERASTMHSGMDVKGLVEELTKRQRIVNQHEVTKADASGQVKTHRELVRQCERELKGDDYKNIDSNLSKLVVKAQTLDMVNKDLDRYYSALDKALMAFHSAKMNDINKVIKELWQRTYRGQDIDYIQIRSDAEKIDGKTGGKSSYNYRVVMICNSAELEMRGRCSAGQKVLSCLIIRLALAETFCLNCGILALDEPTTNLDQPNAESLARSLIDIMQSRKDQENFQLIVITHDVEFAHMLGQKQSADYYWRVTKDENQHSCVEREDIYE